MSQPIPKIIHQTWKTDDLPDDYSRYRKTVRRNHPDWQHRLWTDADNRQLIQDHYPWFLTTYDGYKHSIERADAIRYFILLHHGGVYLDLDMECLKPIDPLIQEGDLHFSLLAGPAIHNTIIGNALMAAPRGHAFFVYLTTMLPRLMKRDVTFSDVFNNTGPDMLTRQIRQCEHMFTFNIIGLDKVCDRCVLHEHPSLDGKSLDTVRAEKLLHFIHHGTNTWNIQHPAPNAPINGFVLFENHDIHGFDIDYVDCEQGDYGKIAEAALQNQKAIAFNYNGYVKGRGGLLEPRGSDDNWVRPGIIPWVCVKAEVAAELRMSTQADRSETGRLGP